MKSLYEFAAGVTLIAFLGLLFLMLVKSGCKSEPSPTKTAEYEIVKIDGCEYIVYVYSAPFVIHKANCPNH